MSLKKDSKVKILKKTQLKGKGLYGIYFRTSSTEGVKIFKNKGYHSIKNIINNLYSDSIQDIIKEATIGKIAGSTKRLGYFKYRNRYYLGIVQRHMGTPLDRTVRIKELKRVRARLRKKKVVHSDLHGNNIVKNNQGQLRAIDFDPTRSYFVGKKRYYYTIKHGLLKNLSI